MAKMASPDDLHPDDLHPDPPSLTGAPATALQPLGRRRHISPPAGRAIEMLGHAIEYLADEFALECRSRDFMPAGKHGSVVAIELLMARNREIYLSCPIVPTLGERLRSFMHLQRAQPSR